MATKKRRVPGLLRHSSGQARVCLSGHFHYCGVFGTLEAAQHYATLVAQWEENGRRPIDPLPDVEQLRPMRDLFARYEAYLDASGRYRKGGVPTSQRHMVTVAIREFVHAFGDAPASRYSEALLLRHRDDLEARVRLTRTGINRKIGMLKAALRWMFGRGLLSRDQWLGTSAIDPLTRHQLGGRDRKQAKRAVSLEDVEKVAVCLPRVPAAMLRLQALVGLRPGEVCAMRWQDIDRTPIVVNGVECWTYRVDSAKTEHHGHETTYPLAPKARAILEGFAADSERFIFSPRQTMLDLHEERRAARETPITKQTTLRDSSPRREFADRYDAFSYRQAIERGIQKAKVKPFTPHEVRHGFVTRVALRCGTMAASVAVNHRRITTTEGYLHADRALAYEVAAQLEAG